MARCMKCGNILDNKCSCQKCDLSFLDISGEFLFPISKNVQEEYRYNDDNTEFLYGMSLCLARKYKEAFDVLNNLAQKDNIEALVFIGLIYENGFLGEPDINKAIEMYEIASDKGNLLAKLLLADMYYAGEKVDKDFDKCSKLYKDCLNMNKGDISYKLGMIYLIGGFGVKEKHSEAEKMFSLSAENGNVNAEIELGRLYLESAQTDKDYIKAMKIFWNGTKQNNAEAMFELGRIYELGLGVQCNAEEAVKLYEQSAELGCVAAMFRMGAAYQFKELGVRKNEVRALKLYTKAAEQGYSDAQCNLGYMYYIGEGVEQDYDKAEEYYRLAAEKGDVRAQKLMSKIFYEGKNEKKNYKESLKWCLLLAEKDDEEAIQMIIKIYNGGYGVKRNLEESENWIRRLEQIRREKSK